MLHKSPAGRPEVAENVFIAPSADVVLQLAGPYQIPGAWGCAEARHGSFGWIQDLSGACSSPVTGSYQSTPVTGGAGPDAICEQAIAAAQASRTYLVIPVATGAASGFGAIRYTLAGFAAFVITGYHFPGLATPDWLNPAATCDPAAICVDGYFTRTLIPGTGSIGGRDLGATIAVLSG